MKGRARTLWLCLACIMVPAAVAEQVYRWTDAAGVVHYTATPPPPGQQSEQVNVQVSKGSPPPAAPPPEPAAGDEKQAADKAEQKREYAQHQREQCVNARNIIQRLETRPSAWYRREDGNYMRYSDEERASKLAEARDFERRYCD